MLEYFRLKDYIFNIFYLNDFDFCLINFIDLIFINLIIIIYPLYSLMLFVHKRIFDFASIYTFYRLMTQSIIVQIGQCGNQIGSQFWTSALKEHAQHDQSGYYSESVASFFRNVENRSSKNLSVTHPPSKIQNLRARAVLIDMEEGVLNGILKSKVGELFNSTEVIRDVSGAGNNWATGFHYYGSNYKDQIVEAIRKECELCDCLQSFFILHSMGGGTGSGLGTRTLSLIEDNFPEVFRFVIPVYPSSDDDVITSPYNTTLAMKQISEYGNCIIPVENQSLSAICQRIGSAKVDNIKHVVQESKDVAFNRMNSFVAKVILDITASARFDGSMNVDMNEISMNLVPFPRANYLIPSLAPLYSPKIPQQRHLDAIFTDVFSNNNTLCKVDLRKGTFLSCALLVRGNVEVSDVRRNVDKLSETTKFVYWNRDGWKTGLCSVAPIKQMYSILSLANSTCIKYTFENLKQRFYKLYSRKAHLHHYLNVDGMEIEQVNEAYESLNQQIEFYNEIEMAKPVEVARPRVM